MLTMGFIGFGKSTMRYHLPYVLIRPNIRIKTIYNHRKKPTDELKYIPYGIRFTQQLDDILKDPEIQLVSICTPPATHFEFAKKAIEAGKNVLVEKPFCETLEEAKILIELANQQKVMIMPYQNRRFDSDFLALKQVLEVGYVGTPVEVETHLDHYRIADQPKATNPMNGQFYGLGVHTIDRMIALFGRPKQVAYDVRSVQFPNSLDDYFEVDLFYDFPLKVKVKTSLLVATNYPQVILHGTKGSFIKYGIDQQENDLKAGIMPGTSNFGYESAESFGRLTYQNANGDWIHKQIPSPQGDYGKVYDAVYQTVLNNRQKLVTDEQILTNIEILAARNSAINPSLYTLPPFSI